MTVIILTIMLVVAIVFVATTMAFFGLLFSGAIAVLKRVFFSRGGEEKIDLGLSVKSFWTFGILAFLGFILWYFLTMWSLNPVMQ